jgi:phosphoketolase
VDLMRLQDDGEHPHGNVHVRGYKEEGTTTTPFDMVMLNDLDWFHLVIDVVGRVRSCSRDARRCASEWSKGLADARGAAPDSNIAATVSTGGDNE